MATRTIFAFVAQSTVLVSVCLPAVAAARAPVDIMRKAAEAPFEVPPDKLVAAAKAHLASMTDDIPPRLLLLDETHWRLEPDGRLVQSVHQIVYVHDEKAVSGMSSVGVSWSPWLEEVPTLKVRVVGPDGTERWLQEDEVAVGSPTQGRDGLFTTDKTVEAPLPGVRTGVVIEQSFDRHPTRPLTDTATTFSWLPTRSEPVLLSRLVLDAPADRAIRSTLPSGAPKPSVQRTGNSERTTWEQADLPPHDIPKVIPMDFELPVWRFSTGGSWGDIARSYLDRVASKQTRDGTEALVEKLTGSTDRRTQIAEALEAVRTAVRYTGLEFGESAIVPYTPAEALGRGYGDCKDQANLLVVLLESLGIPARLALVDATGVDAARPEHPGLEPFDHVIVYLPDDNLWIDPTFPPAAVGTLPVPLYGRNALIIDGSTEALTPIPDIVPAEHRYRETRRLHYTAGRSTSYDELVEATGFLAHDLSMVHMGMPARPTDGPLARYAESEYGSTDLLVAVQGTSATQPEFTLRLTGTAPSAIAWDAPITLNPLYSVVFEHLPSIAFMEPTSENRAPGPVEVLPFESELVFEITPPKGYFPLDTIDPASVQAGDASLTWTPTWNAESHTLRATLRFSTGDGVFSPDELDTLRSWTKTGVADFAPVQLDDPAKALLAIRQSPEAIRHYNQIIEQAPTEPWAYSRRALALLDLGLGEAARASAEQAVVVAPDSSYSWFDLGYVRMHDALGRQLSAEVDRTQSIAAYEKVLELNGPGETSLRNMALVLDLDRDGLGRLRNPEATVQAYERWLAGPSPGAADRSVLGVFLEAGQNERVLELTEKLQTDDAIRARLVAVARLSGAQALLTEARRRSRTREIENAHLEAMYESLIGFRDYALLADLLTARPDLVANPVQAAAVTKQFQTLRRFEEVLDPDQAPEHTLYRLMVGCLEFSGIDGLDTAVTARETAAPEGWRDFCTGMRGPMTQTNLPMPFVVDSMLSEAAATTESPTRKSRKVSWSLSEERALEGYVTQVDQKWRLAALAGISQQVGVEALYQLEHGDRAEAEQWMAWLLTEHLSRAAEPTGPLFADLSAEFDAAGVPTKVRDHVLAAAAAAGTQASTRAWRKYGPKAAAKAPETTAKLLHATLPELARSRDLDAYFELARARWAIDIFTDDRNAELERRHIFYAEPERALANLPAAADRTPEQWNQAANLLMRLGKYADSVLAFEQAQSIEPNPNNRAWAMVLAGAPPETIVELLGSRSGKASDVSTAELHTLATALAEADQPDAAHHLLRRAIQDEQLGPSADLGPEWWYVIGRMAESYGLPDAARRAYQKVPVTEAMNEIRVLCDRRLQQLPPAASGTGEGR